MSASQRGLFYGTTGNPSCKGGEKYTQKTVGYSLWFGENRIYNAARGGGIFPIIYANSYE
jgi:hypothetical protein